jgi:hypothetical protein
MMNWREVAEGVLVWEPSASIAMEATSQSLSRLGVDADAQEGMSIRIAPTAS